MGIFTIFVISPFYNIKIFLKYIPFDTESNSLSSQVYLNIFQFSIWFKLQKKQKKAIWKYLNSKFIYLQPPTTKRLNFFFILKKLKFCMRICKKTYAILPLTSSILSFNVSDSYEIACFKSFIRKTSHNIIFKKFIFAKSSLCSIRIYIYFFFAPCGYWENWVKSLDFVRKVRFNQNVSEFRFSDFLFYNMKANS